MYVNRNRATA